MKKFIFILTLLSFSSNLYAESSKWASTHYVLEPNDNLLTIVKKFIIPNHKIKKDGPILKRNLDKNKNIKNWKDPISGTSIKLLLPRNLFNKEVLKEYGQKQIELKKEREEEKKKREEVMAKSPWSFGIFYMASNGNFTQTQDEISINFQQNSPFSLGVSANYRLSYEYSLNSSLYTSYLTVASNSLSDEKVSIKPEIGSNIYLTRKLGASWKVYAGFDLERFSTFNIDDIRDTGMVVRDENRMSFATFGIDKFFTNSFLPFLLRFSVSSSLTSQRITYDADNDQDLTFSGLKYMLYFNAPVSNRIFFHILYKQHIMTGPSELNSYRIGLGLGIGI